MMTNGCRRFNRWVCLAAFFWGACASAKADFTPAKTNSLGFILQLGLDTKTVQITPEYKEAALQASLPLFSDFAQKLQLPSPHPLTRSDIVDCGMIPIQKTNGEIDQIFIETKQGFSFAIFLGVVRSFSWPNSYRALQNIHEISSFFGTVKISREQAIQSARDTLNKIGIPLEDVFAEQEPQVRVPVIGTNTVARYIIKWRDPRESDDGSVTVEAEVNAETGRVENFQFSPANGLKKPGPKINVPPPLGHGVFDSQIPPPTNPDYAWKLIPLMLAAIDEYGQKLALPIPSPLTTNNLARVEVHNNEGWPHAEVTLTNGWRFVYRHAMVNGYYAPDNFFSSDNRRIHVKDFKGKWNLNTNQAVAVVKSALAKLSFPTNNIHLNFSPKIIFAGGDFRKKIPRYFFEWLYENATHDDLQSKVEAEVNADTGKVESLYYDDKAYWNSRPPIDVPISIK